MSDNEEPAPAPVVLPGLSIRRQPNDQTCGPACLHAVYRHFGLDVSLEEVIAEIPMLAAGGTLAVLLGTHALKKGLEAELFTFDLRTFDPTWFQAGVDLPSRLAARRSATGRPKLGMAIDAYLGFLAAGGKVRMEELTAELLRRPLKAGLPVLTGLSSTWLYREPRELPDGRPDDVGGEPQGHFVVLSGYDPRRRQVFVTDPLHPNPLAVAHTYQLPLPRVVGAILLGVLTFDANLLVLRPPAPSPQA